MQNGITAADVAEASGHEDLCKELMAHSLSRQDVRHTDDVSYHCRLYNYISCSSRLAIIARKFDPVETAHCMYTCDFKLLCAVIAITFLLLKVEANKRKARILQTTNLLNTLMQALEYKLEMLTSENEEQPKKGIASVEDIIKGHQDVYPVIQPPLRITEDPERKLLVSSNETDTIEEKESSSKETNEGEVPES